MPNVISDSKYFLTNLAPDENGQGSSEFYDILGNWIGRKSDEWIRRRTQENPECEAATWVWRMARTSWFEGINIDELAATEGRFLERLEALIRLKGHAGYRPVAVFLLNAHYAVARVNIGW